MLKRLIIGSPMSSEQAGHTLLAKRLALPIFASDALSSVAYATQEILLVLTVGGTAFLYLAPWVAVGVVVLMAAVVASYRQLVRAYPTGGGDYEVATQEHRQAGRRRRRQRAARRLRDDGRGVGVVRRRQHHLGGAVAARTRGSWMARRLRRRCSPR